MVVDLDFEEQMTQSEINSICHQLMHSYSANSRAAAPCHLHFTSIKARFCASSQWWSRLYKRLTLPTRCSAQKLRIPPACLTLRLCKFVVCRAASGSRYSASCLASTTGRCAHMVQQPHCDFQQPWN